MNKNKWAEIKHKIRKISPNSIVYFYSIIINKIRKRKYRKRFLNLTVDRKVSFSKDCFFGRNVRIGDNTSLNTVKIGDYSCIGRNNVINSTEIGKYCSIASDVKIGLGMHPSRGFVSTHPAFYGVGDVFSHIIYYADKSYFTSNKKNIIGNDVWIGANALIKDGVVIGDGAIIGAGAVVVKNVDSYAIMGGVPAKLIRYRFTEKEIDLLEKIKWWNKSEKWIKDNWIDFLDIKQFINKHSKRL